MSRKLIEAIKAIRPAEDTPELSERAYRQACDDCIQLIRQHSARTTPAVVDEHAFQKAIEWLGPPDDVFNQWHLEEGNLRAFAARLRPVVQPDTAMGVDAVELALHIEKHLVAIGRPAVGLGRLIDALKSYLPQAAPQKPDLASIMNELPAGKCGQVYNMKSGQFEDQKPDTGMPTICRFCRGLDRRHYTDCPTNSNTDTGRVSEGVIAETLAYLKSLREIKMACCATSCDDFIVGLDLTAQALVQHGTVSADGGENA